MPSPGALLPLFFPTRNSPSRTSWCGSGQQGTRPQNQRAPTGSPRQSTEEKWLKKAFPPPARPFLRLRLNPRRRRAGKKGPRPRQQTSGNAPAKAAEPKRRTASSTGNNASFPPLKRDQPLKGAFRTVKKQTKPPPHHTEATLLSAMETAGRAIADEALRDAMKDCGLGTPANSASTIETLIKRKFIRRDKKDLPGDADRHGTGRKTACNVLGPARAHEGMGKAVKRHRPWGGDRTAFMTGRTSVNSSPTRPTAFAATSPVPRPRHRPHKNP